MARSYGALKVAVWEAGSDFRKLTPLGQWGYAMLISQPQLNNLGVLPYTPEKWVRFAAGLTLVTLDEALLELQAKDYIVVDVDAAELLIRTFIKHDKVWQQPKLITNARKLVREVESDPIRALLTARHPWLLDTSTRDEIDAYEKAAAKPTQTPIETGSETPSDTHIPTRAPAGPARAGPGPGVGVGPSSAVRTESSHSKAEAGLTRASFEHPAPASDTNALDTTDPINRLVLELRDHDEGTAHVLRTRYGGLAEAAFVYTREEVIRCRTDTDSDAGLATRILERISETGFIGDPDFAPANGQAAAPPTRTPYERAELLIRNIGPTLEPRDLDRELDDIGITDQTEREQLHELLDQLRQDAA